MISHLFLNLKTTIFQKQSFEQLKEIFQQYKNNHHDNIENAIVEEFNGGSEIGEKRCLLAQMQLVYNSAYHWSDRLHEAIRV